MKTWTKIYLISSYRPAWQEFNQTCPQMFLFIQAWSLLLVNLNWNSHDWRLRKKQSSQSACWSYWIDIWEEDLLTLADFGETVTTGEGKKQHWKKKNVGKRPNNKTQNMFHLTESKLPLSRQETLHLCCTENPTAPWLHCNICGLTYIYL